MRMILQPLDKIFNRLFSSKYNPLYNTGTIAVALLMVAIVTGLYLCFFYRLGEPFESVQALSDNFWLGRWVRSLHRYTSDAMVVAVLIHVLRMFAQGKTWGPRAMAWVSGVFLMIFMLVSGWTGFVLVWDAQGQAVAAGGARMMDALGIFADPISRSFDGSSNPPTSFFFLNLFLHIVIPLAMVFGLWLHTSKMANAVWFPAKKFQQSLVGVLILVSVIWPAPLAEKADLLKVPSAFPTDWFYNFWLPWAESHPLATFLGLAGLFTILILVPWLRRPQQRPEKSSNEQKNCQGCSQCVQDCPYEAISMVTRTEGEGSAMVARVNPDLCVSCGLCAASCVPFTMGPPGRKGGDQFAAARTFLNSLRLRGINPKESVLILGCSLQTGLANQLRGFTERNPGFQVYPVACTGTTHAVVFEHFTKNFSSVAVVACPERNCTNKDGSRLLRERLTGVREPTFENAENRKKLQLFSAGEGEEKNLFRELLCMKKAERASPSPRKIHQSLIATASGVAIVVGLAAITRISAAPGPESGYLRLGFRLSGQSAKTCRARTPEELRALPDHMRTAELCDYKSLSYRLLLIVDGQQIVDERIRPGGLHSDRPIYVDRDLPLAPGPHKVHISFLPLEDDSGTAIALNLEKEIRVTRGRVALVHLSPDQKQLLIKGDEG